MSPDDMLAAQLWPWPDPIIKRDLNGGVIFVNAAFLQSYGGQVTDWHGCAVDGWPMPVQGPVPSRFETRFHSPTGEQVFDWLEYIMPDGGALAIARNITGLMASIPPQGPGTPAQQPNHMASDSFQSESASLAEAPVAEAPVTEHMAIEPVANILTANIPTANIQEDTFSAPPTQLEESQPIVSVEAEHAPVGQAPAEMTSVAVNEAQHVQPEPVTEERDYQRRALPIEDDEKLLGSNWRDAVIAKAVGADETAVQPSPPEEQVGEKFDEALDETAIAAPESKIEQNSNEPQGTIRILLAEDNAINALLTRTLLEADGCYVEVVEDGSLAVEAVRNNQYDMILMDMRMPNMDGLEATRKIRALSEEAKSIPIVALTANAFDDDRNACFDAGMNDFMTKPVSAEELQQMAMTWAKQQPAAA